MTLKTTFFDNKFVAVILHSFEKANMPKKVKLYVGKTHIGKILSWRWYLARFEALFLQIKCLNTVTCSVPGIQGEKYLSVKQLLQFILSPISEISIALFRCQEKARIVLRTQ